MQIEVGEYKTRGGDDVRVIAVVDGIVIGYFAEYGPTSVNYWKAENGRYFTKHDAESRGDLVGKKPNRIKREAWLTIYNEEVDGVVAGGGYATKDRAQEKRAEDCIAIVRVEIDCEEGENLD